MSEESGENPRITRLSLSRRYGEGIQIEGPAVITVTESKGRRVLITIQAENDVRIRRMELVPEDEQIAPVPEVPKCEDEGDDVPKSPPPARLPRMEPFRVSGITVPGHRVG